MYTYWQDYYKSVIIKVSRSSTYLKLIKYKFTYELTKQPGQVVYMTVLHYTFAFWKVTQKLSESAYYSS